MPNAQAVYGDAGSRLTVSAAGATIRVHQALMASPTHRANILESRFSRLAVGGTSDAQGQLVFAEIFRAGP